MQSNNSPTSNLPSNSLEGQLAGRRLVLASQSPRRRELLGSLGMPFKVIVPSAAAEPDDAQPMHGESIPEFAERLAIQKAHSVASTLPYSAIVIGCDTVADVDGQLLGKPKDRDDARRMLQLLSGRQHSVWSGLCLIETPTGKQRSAAAESQLIMTRLDDQQLEAYLNLGEWQGKSGAFGYQDGHDWLSITKGTAENVVGLPIDLLKQLIREFN